MANTHNLYDLVDYFTLEVDGVITTIDEPINWDKVAITADRDKDYFGFNYEFVDNDNVVLRFPKKNGYEIIKRIYNRDGSDGNIKFEYGYTQFGVKKPQFKGNLNLNNYNDDFNSEFDFIECSVEKVQFNSKLRTRSDTKVSLNSVLDLDENPIVPPQPITIKLHSKKIKKAGKLSSNFPQATFFKFSNHNNNWLQFDTSNIITSEVSNLYSMPLDISTFDASPIAEKRFNFQPEEDGKVELKFSAHYHIKGTVAPAAQHADNYTITPSIVIRRNDNTIFTYTNPAANLAGAMPDHKNFEVTHDFSLSTFADIKKDDEVYFLNNIVVDGNANVMGFTITDYTSMVMEIIEETQAPVSFCKGYKLIDIFNYVVNSCTGVSNAVKSSLMEAGGDAYKYIVTNGFQIRNFDIINHPVKAAFTDLIEGFCPIWCSGIQYQDNKIIFERFKDMFGNKRIMQIDNIYDYNEEHAKDITYNEAEIGYTKYSEAEYNTLDEFNTYHQLLMPISSYKAKYIKKSGFITSGYTIEDLRREQFKTSPSTSLSQDDDLFLISYVEESIYRDVQYQSTANGGGVSFIDFNKSLGLIIGDQFKINDAGSFDYNTVFTVQSKDINFPERYYVTPAMFGETRTSEIQILITSPQAERNEAFTQIDNLISPDTAYNLRISPQRMFYNHSWLLNCCLWKKPLTAKIKNTYQKNNGKLITTFAASELNKQTVQNYTIAEDSDIILDDFNNGERLFTPILSKFKAAMYYDDILKLKSSLRGEAGNDTDFGTIAFIDKNNELWEGYVWTLSYDPSSEISSFTVRKLRKI